MTYDPVDANDDGIVESDVNNESVSTSQALVDHGNISESLISPFSPSTSLTTVTGGGYQAGLTSGAFVIGDKWTIVYRRADNHGTDTDSVIVGVDTYDKGATLTNQQIIADTPNDLLDFRTAYDKSDADGKMDNGRLGILATRRDGNGTVLTPTFIYSDDDGATWTQNNLTSMPEMGIYEFRRYPSSVGGADSGGWIAFGQTFQNDELKYIFTTDNGDTWTSGTVVSKDFRHEPSVARVGDQDKWIMVVRTGGSTNAFAYRSDDLTTWTDETNTGVPLRGNPPEIRYYNGHIYWLTFSRRSPEGVSSGGVGDFGDGILHQSVDADVVYSDLTAWPGFELLTQGLGNNVGYPFMFRDDGKWFSTCHVGERENISDTNRDVAQVAILSSGESAPRQEPRKRLIEANIETGLAASDFQKVVDNYSLRNSKSFVNGRVRAANSVSSNQLSIVGGESNLSISSSVSWAVETDTSAGDNVVDIYVANNTSGTELDIEFAFWEIQY